MVDPEGEDLIGWSKHGKLRRLTHEAKLCVVVINPIVVVKQSNLSAPLFSFPLMIGREPACRNYFGYCQFCYRVKMGQVKKHWKKVKLLVSLIGHVMCK